MAAPFPPSVRWLAPTMIVKGVDTVVSVDVERDGVSLSFSSTPTLSVYDDSGAAVGSPRNMTESGTTLTATIDAADTASIDGYSDRYLVVIDYTVTNEQARKAYNAAALCLADLTPPVGVGDLTARHALLASLQSNRKISLQGHIAQAWGELLSQLYADETPFWNLRSPAALRPWMLTRSTEIALRDAALPLAVGNPYSVEADRLAALLVGEAGLYRNLQIRIANNNDNVLEARSAPVVDTRRTT